MKYDVKEMADFLLENADVILDMQGEQKKEMLELLRDSLEALPIEGLRELCRGNAERAKKFLFAWKNICGAYLGRISLIHNYIMILLETKLFHYEQAEKYCKDLQINKFSGKNEIIWFYMGNNYANWGKASEAVFCYQEALKIKKSFLEAAENLKAVQNGEKIPYTIPNADVMNFPEEKYQEIPIFINSRDRVECLKKLLYWLLEAGYQNIIILDNASTYSPLLQYYDEITKFPQVSCIYLGENMGHTALWDSGVLEQLDIRTPYVYTDSDVLPVENCPKSVLRDLLRILKRYPYVDKVGLGIKTDDITYHGSEDTRKWEDKYHRFLLENDLAFAPVDTTFALYQNIRYYTILFAARTLGMRMIRHLPWYYDYGNLPEDEIYYMKYANKSSTVSNAIKDIRKEEPEYQWGGFF